MTQKVQWTGGAALEYTAGGAILWGSGWPDALDYEPLNETYAHVFADARARNPVEQGIARQRRLYSAALMNLQMEWMFSPTDFETFRSFYDSSTAEGTRPFTLSVFTGSVYEDVLVNFIKGKVKAARAEGEWKVSATLETAELPVMSSAALDAIIGAAPGGGALPAWPAAWSYGPLDRDLGVQFPEPTLRSDFEDGFLPQARLFKSGVATFKVTLPMPNAQYDAFRAWRVYRIYNGEGWFTMPVFRGGSYETHNVRIVKGSLKATREGYDWLVHASLELRDLPGL